MNIERGRRVGQAGIVQTTCELAWIPWAWSQLEGMYKVNFNIQKDII